MSDDDKPRQAYISKDSRLCLGTYFVCDLWNTSPRLVNVHINDVDTAATVEERKLLRKVVHSYYEKVVSSAF